MSTRKDSCQDDYQERTPRKYEAQITYISHTYGIDLLYVSK